MLQSINPTNDEVIREYEELTEQEIASVLQKSQTAFEQWRETDFSHRAPLMKKAAEVLRDHRQEYAELMAREMGKPVLGGRSEVEKCAWVCEYYAEHAESFLADQPIETDASNSFVAFQPLGVVLAVMPWNFPFWQVFRFAAPGLMAGNAGVLKHASNVTGCALAIEEVFREAGFPEHLFRTLKISSSKVGRVIEHPIVKAVTLTGSVPAGKAVAQKAGSVLKKTVLELGGSDPYVILEDADLDLAVPTCVNSRLINSGQSCIAAKRFIVVDKVREEFEQRFVDIMEQKTMGDPMDEGSDIGPQARTDLRDELHGQVEQSIKQGAQCLLGGKIPGQKGAWYPPTVLANVKPGMPAYGEELFGPVASIITAKDEDDAIRIANDSRFGLGAAVFTRDAEKGTHIAAEKLQAGCCFVNSLVKSDPRLPFGGIRESGYGRELSHFGIKEFVNIKTVYVK
ncbi:succinate-semialdehyde dehydrogenase / glutarate-semialdehyde dehydrogenase [Fodinibius roseus]|uniref:Succinate-semialdehyde dehydrogenase / glutarate-semialdehyde dehydrogenase n=1 Tax=Fodinibius roseus TaxID=1194090 RepID=A0A1M5B6D0_9BACT|nr:NAD-dependent succinate-semialdehyde dehydrogenase [Fodinibius roseus]SHF38063.1 succinate-semialdehyde dehydrogenase / glutarate-semialdehyde dehydrogenase [Fodinibius roseus]